MCKSYNTIGSLIAIQNQLVNNNIDDFNSLNELIDFLKNYHIIKQETILNHTRLIKQEQEFLEKYIVDYNENISIKKHEIKQKLNNQHENLYQQIENLPDPADKIIPVILDYYKNLVIWIKIWYARAKFRFDIFFLEWQSKKIFIKKQNRLEYIRSNFQDAVNESSLPEFENLSKKKTVIEEVYNTIYGAFGEQKVANILEKLPDNYILINDFTCHFEPPIHNRKDNDYIKSVQIDHLVVAPSGIFIIETKNWNDHSIANINLRSPVQQVQRTSYALFKLLNDEINHSGLNFKKHHWGNRKIPIKNLIVFTNNKPVEEFQFVKILTLNELLRYVKYFTPTFEINETQAIADFLLKISNQRKPNSKLQI